MAVNLLDMLKEQVVGKVAGQLGTHIGESEQATKGGLEALLPTVLGGLVKQASEPGGADALGKTLDQDDYDGGLLDNIGGMLGGGDTSAVSGLGEGLLKMVFGGKISAIIGIISKLTGMGGKSTTSLLGLALPLIMSFLGKQKRSMGLDSQGFASMLMDQKDSIGASLPAGVSDELGLGALGIKGPASPAPSSAPAPSNQPSGGGGLMKLLIPLVLIAALGFLAMKFLGGGGNDADPENVKKAQEPDEGLGVDLGNLTVPGLDDAKTKLTDSMSNLTDIFGGITDADSAQEKLADLQAADKGLGGITSMLDKAPDGLKSGLISAAGGMIPGLQAAIDKVMAIPGVGDILKPVVDSLKEKLGMLAA